MVKVKWTDKANKHLFAIFEYIAKDSTTYAARFVKSLILATKKLESMPYCGRKVPEFNNRDFREVIYKNYRIIYRLSEDRNNVEILAVIHGSRDLERALGQDRDWLL